MAKLLVVSIALSFFFCFSSAFVPFPAQDFCVAAPGIQSNGLPLPCKDPKLVSAEDFYAGGLHLPGNTANPLGAAVTALHTGVLPGLNTLGLTIARLDLAKGGFVPPHTHPRATEIISVMEGSLEVGFVSSGPGYKLLSKVLGSGDTFVIPVGMVHYQRNVAPGNTVAFIAVNNQNPGIVAIPSALFGATPEMNGDYLSAVFGLDKNIVDGLLGKF